MNQLTSRSEVLVPSCPAIMDDSILDTIGNTPLIEIKHIGKEFPNVKIFAKAEWRNAGGSVKSRPALSMIEDGEKTGKLTRDKILLDSTSGNTGIAYALIGKVKGYKVKLVMPENVINERKGKMAAFYGAEIIASSPFEGSDGAIVLAKKIYEEDPINILCQINIAMTLTGRLITIILLKKSGSKQKEKSLILPLVLEQAAL
jgi:S-sulfo-L-cysteine synthase (O-acetyl-L-serine-dependent)